MIIKTVKLYRSLFIYMEADVVGTIWEFLIVPDLSRGYKIIAILMS